MNTAADRQRTTVALANAYLLGDHESLAALAQQATPDLDGALQIQSDAIVFATVLQLVQAGVDKVLAHPTLLARCAIAARDGQPVRAADLHLDAVSVLAAAGLGATQIG